MSRQNDVLRKLQELDQRVHVGKARLARAGLYVMLRSWEVIMEGEKN